MNRQKIYAIAVILLVSTLTVTLIGFANKTWTHLEAERMYDAWQQERYERMKLQDRIYEMEKLLEELQP